MCGRRHTWKDVPMKVLTASLAVLATLSFASVAYAEGCSWSQKRAEAPPPVVGS
jgi:hypothetical protein